MSRPVLKVGNTFSDTATAVPSRGFRPVRALRVLTANTPKPRNSTRSPRASAVVIVSKMVLTILSTSRWYRCGLSAAILSISSDLIIGAFGCLILHEYLSYVELLQNDPAELFAGHTPAPPFVIPPLQVTMPSRHSPDGRFIPARSWIERNQR